MADHVSSLCRSVYYELRQLRPVVRSITEDAAKMVAHAIISSRLDYCNSLLCGIAGNLLQKLQSVQNAAARLIMRTGRRQHITPVLRELHCYQFDSVLISRWLFLYTRRYTASFHSTWLKIVSSWPTLAADHCDPLMSWRVPQREHIRVSETGVFPALDRLFWTLYLSHYVTETSHLNSLRDFC